MSPSTADENSADCIDVIREDTLHAILALEATDAAKGALTATLDKHLANLKIVAGAHLLGLKKQIQLAQKLLLHPRAARVCAVLRALARGKKPATFAEVMARADLLTVWKPHPEPVRVTWISKAPKPGYRPIVVSGPVRTAQALMVRDLLLMMNIDSDFDCAKKGGGGEKRLIKNVCEDIEDGKHWLWTPDIKNCFGSIRPGHLGWLPTDGRLLKNVMFLPKCAKVVVSNDGPEEVGLILQSLGLGIDVASLSVDALRVELLHFTVQVVRRGLVQGSVLSPLLARAVVAQNVHAALDGLEVSTNSISDDLIIRAKTKVEIFAARLAVTKLFSSLPDGPIELHDVLPINANSRRAEAVGYRLEPGNGFGANYVHVKPWLKRVAKFKQRLFTKLKAAKPDDDLFEIAEKYRARWFASQGAWTKVPELSDNVSAAITASYVDDYNSGLPMGTWNVGKSKFDFLTQIP